MMDAAADLYGTVAVTGANYPGAAPDAGAIVALEYVRNVDPAPGLRSYTVHLVTTDPAYSTTAFGGRFDGPMNQVWVGDIMPTPTMTRAGLLAPAQQVLDSHVLLTDDQLFSTPDGTPREDRDAGTGLGNYLAESASNDMVFGFVGGTMSSDIALAQIVIPAGEQVTITGDAGYKWGPAGSVQYGENSVSLTFPAEPATFSLDYTVTNGGDADAGAFTVDFYLSGDTTVPDGGDSLLQRVQVPGLAAGASTGGSLAGLTVPVAGTWHVGMVIDADAQIAESDESNNQAVDDVPDKHIVAFGGKTKAKFLDANGDAVTISVKGPGTGWVELTAANGFDADAIFLNGSTAKSSLIIQTKGKGTWTSVGTIAVDGPLAAVTGKTADLTGSLAVAGSLGKLVLGNVTDDHTISIGPRAAGDTRTAVAITLGRVADTVLTSQTPIKSLTVTDWLDNAGATDSVQAPWMGKLTAKGNKRGGVVGHFQADLALNGAGAAKAVLGSAKVAGDLGGVDWDINGAMGKLTVVGTATDSTVRADAIAGIAVGASDGSDFLAGIDPAVVRHADGVADFQAPAATIKSFKVTGLKGPGAARYFFVDSNISAATIGAVKLLNVDFDNAAAEFGVWARNANTGKEIKSVKWADKVDKAVKDSWSPKSGLLFSEPDLAISVLST